jgi:hypothetical protein
MHDCEPYGVLAVNGRAMSAAQVARLVGEQEKIIVRLLAELEDAGVCSRDDEGRLFSRRMVKDEEVREARAAGGHAGAEHGHKGGEHGKKGGRPRKAEAGSSAEEKTPLKTPLAVSEEPPPSSSSSPSGNEEAKASLSASSQPPDVDEPDDGVPPCPFDSLIDSYEAALPVLPTVRRSLFAKGANGKALRARWRWVMTAKHERGERKGERIATTVDEGKAWFGRYFDYVAESDFLSGRSGKFQAKPSLALVHGGRDALAFSLPALVLCRHHPSPPRPQRFAVGSFREQRTSHGWQDRQSSLVAVDQAVERARRHAIVRLVHIRRLRRSRQRSFSFFITRRGR